MSSWHPHVHEPAPCHHYACKGYDTCQHPPGQLSSTPPEAVDE